MSKPLRISLVIISVLLLAAIFKTQSNKSKLEDELAYHTPLVKSVILKSSAFEEGGKIPVEYTGKNPVSPPLEWDNIPEGTRSLAIVVTDYDAPSPVFKLFVVGHWELYNIPVKVNSIEKAVSTAQLENMHTTVGKNFMGEHNYIGPRPPFGVHDYYFRIYALDFSSLFLNDDNRDELMHAMKGHILGYGELVGKF